MSVIIGTCGALAVERYGFEEECIGAGGVRAGGAEGRCIFSLLDGEDEEERELGPVRCVDDDDAPSALKL